MTTKTSAPSAAGTAILVPFRPSIVDAAGSDSPGSHIATVPRPSSSGCSSRAAQCEASGVGASEAPSSSATTASSTIPKSAISGQPSSTTSSQVSSAPPSRAISRTRAIG